MENNAGKISQTYPLKKILGAGFGIAVLVGSTIGVGILRTPGVIAGLLGNYSLVIGSWLFGGVYILIGASSVAELATMLPKAGGPYQYVRTAFGPYAGFVTGWFDYTTYAIAPAYFCIAISEYLAALFPSLSGLEKPIALGILVLFLLLHSGGLKYGSVAQQITSVIKLVLFVTLIICCFVAGRTSVVTPHAAKPMMAIATGGLVFGVLRSLQLVIGTYDGWMSVCFFAEEEKNPAKNIPRSLFSGSLIVMCLYVILNFAFFHVLPVSVIASSTLAASDVATVLFGDAGGKLVMLVALVSLASILNAHMMIPARILFALSRDGNFRADAARINKGGTPVGALLFSVAISFVLIIAGSFETLFALGAFMAIMVLAATCCSLIWLRKKQPSFHRPYLAWGYPWTTGILLLMSVAMLLAFSYSDPKNFLVIVILLLLSYPAYRLVSKSRVEEARR